MKSSLYPMPALVMLIALFSTAKAEEPTVDAAGVLAIAKMAGACGILSQLLVFQSTTQMPGGDEFVLRFVNTEAARLGMTIEEVASTCGSSVAQYDTVWAAANQR